MTGAPARIIPGVASIGSTVARVNLPRGEALGELDIVETSLPVGAYADAQVTPTCGLAGLDAVNGLLDDRAAFYEPDHLHAQLVWFRHGRLAYRFPNRLPPRARAETLWFSAEVCSEAPMHHHDWPSDVTLDDLELGAHPYVELAIGVEANARHVGGLNLFGRAFGNYPQDLVLRVRHRPVVG